jgi:plasmid maintenance system killer protein
MIQSFKNKGAEDLFNGISSREARQTCPYVLWRVVARKLDPLDSVEMLDELRILPGTGWSNYLGSVEVNTVFESMISTGSVSYGQIPVQIMLKSLIIISLVGRCL